MYFILSLINTLFLAFSIFTLLIKYAESLPNITRLIIAVSFSFFILSTSYYISLVVKLPIETLIWASFALLTAIIAIQHKHVINLSKSAVRTFENFDKISVLTCAGVFLLTCGFASYADRWGAWDAIAIWNLHAKFLYDPNNWRSLFTNDISFTHPDYPLMLPSLIAYYWKAAGEITPLIPAILSYTFLICVPLVICSSLHNSRFKLLPLLALAIFAADRNYLTIASAQYADTLLALFILLTFILNSNLKLSSPKLPYILGFCAAIPTWIKNEGILFFAVFSIVIMLFNFKIFYKYLIGCLLVILLNVTFKIYLAPVNDLIAASSGKNATLLQYILDYKRYLTIANYAIHQLTDYVWLIIVVLLSVFYNPKFFKSYQLLIVFIVLCGYMAVYVLTPNDLHWHLETSFNRVIHHLYPSIIYLLFLSYINKVTHNLQLSNVNVK